jgi:hypothetical protein
LSVILVEQAAEPVTPLHTAAILADDGWTGPWIWWLQLERPVGTVDVVMLDVDLKGAQTRSCSSPVLVEQTAEQVTSTHPALPILADDGQPGGWVRRCKPERPVGTVAV